MEPGASDISEVIPEVQQQLPGLDPSPALEPERARFRLFDSITTFLKNAAAFQPLMLVLDDLHWADKPSLLLLAFLVRQLADTSLLVVGCYRDPELTRRHPLSETLAHLAREPVFQRQALRGLSQEHTGQLIEATAGVQPPQELAATIYDHTEGNPFFMTEVIRLLSEQGDLLAEEIAEPHTIRIPEGVREVIGQRLNRLSEECNNLMTTAAIIGREFDFRLLSALNGETSENQLLAALEERRAARIIQEPPETVGRYQFTHALIQETLVEEVSYTNRARLHGRIGDALEELYGRGVGEHAAELAHHFAEAEAVLGGEKLVRYSKLAGGWALSSYAYEEAEVYFRRALTSWEEQELEAEPAEILYGLARAVAATGGRMAAPEVLGFLGRAFQYYFDEGDIARATEVA